MPVYPGAIVAVGTAVACCPPHRPVLALLTHTVPTLDSWRRSARLRCFAHTLTPAFPAFPARCPERVRLLRVLLSQQPSLRNLRRRLPAFVRLPRRYYAAVRLPAAVHGGLMAHRLLLPARTLPAGGNGVSRFSRIEFLCMHGVFDSAGPRLARVCASARCCLPCCPTPSAPRNTRFRSSIPSLQIPLSNASSAALLLLSHGSGPRWFAIPSLYDSFIRYSMPVYPGAIRTKGSALGSARGSAQGSARGPPRGPPRPRRTPMANLQMLCSPHALSSADLHTRHPAHGADTEDPTHPGDTADCAGGPRLQCRSGDGGMARFTRRRAEVEVG